VVADSRSKIFLSRRTTVGEGETVECVERQPLRQYQATLTGNGLVTATVEIWVSNDNHNWLIMARFLLSGTNFDTCGFAAQNPCQYSKAVVTAITGTDAAVDVSMGD